MLILRFRDLLIAVKLHCLHTLAAVAENEQLSGIRFGHLEDYRRSRPFDPAHVLERCALHSGLSLQELYLSLYTPVVNEIHYNGPDAPGLLAVPHEGPVPTPEEILRYLYCECRNRIEDPLFYPPCYQL